MKRLPKLFTLTALALAAVASGAHVQDEEPFWAKGRPHSDAAAKMAPVAAKSIPTSVDKLPAGKMKLPPGSKSRSGPATCSTRVGCGRVIGGRCS